MDPSPKCVVRGLRQEELALEKDAARHVPKPLGDSPESRGGGPPDSRAVLPPPLRILTAERPRVGAAREGAPAAGDCSPAAPQGSGRERGTGAPRRHHCGGPRPGLRAPARRTATALAPSQARGNLARPSRSCGLSLGLALRNRRALGAQHKFPATVDARGPGRVCAPSSRAPR